MQCLYAMYWPENISRYFHELLSIQESYLQFNRLCVNEAFKFKIISDHLESVLLLVWKVMLVQTGEKTFPEDEYISDPKVCESVV